MGKSHRMATSEPTMHKPVNLTTNISRYSEPPPPAFPSGGSDLDDMAPSMTYAETKEAQKQAEITAAQAEVDRMAALRAEGTQEAPFGIPRADHSAAGTLDNEQEKAMFYATSNKIYGTGNGLAFTTKPFRRRGLDGTFTAYVAGDKIGLEASGDKCVWARKGLDTSHTMHNVLPRSTAWGTQPNDPPTCAPGALRGTGGH